MLQCNLKFESALFTNLIIYIIFLFKIGQLSFFLTFFFLSSISSFPCLTNFYSLSLSLSHFLVQPFLCFLSLYSTSLPPSPVKPRLISMVVVSFSFFFYLFIYFGVVVI